MLQFIRLLCLSGAGLQAIASPFCEAVRMLVGAASGSIFWLSDSDEPLGFYHDSATAEIKDLFVSAFDESFFATEPVNLAHMVSKDGLRVGKMLDAGLQAGFRNGNIHRLLCRPLGHDLFIDMSALAPGLGKAVFCGWYPPGRAPTTADADALEPVQPMMQAALAAGDAGADWRSVTLGNPHLLACIDGRDLLAIDDEAERILMASQLLRQNVSPLSRPSKAPGFVAVLAEQLASRDHGELHLPVPGGRLVCRASRTRIIGAGGGIGGDRRTLVSFDLQVAREVAKVRYLMDLDLAPLQRDIAAHALFGGGRRDCVERFGVGPEALKKHLRMVFAATGTGCWSELQQLDLRLAGNPDEAHPPAPAANAWR